MKIGPLAAIYLLNTLDSSDWTYGAHKSVKIGKKNIMDDEHWIETYQMMQLKAGEAC